MPYDGLSDLIEAARKEKIRLNKRNNQARTTQEQRYIEAVEEVYEASLEYLEQDNSFSKTHTNITQ